MCIHLLQVSTFTTLEFCYIPHLIDKDLCDGKCFAIVNIPVDWWRLWWWRLPGGRGLRQADCRENVTVWNSWQEGSVGSADSLKEACLVEEACESCETRIRSFNLSNILTQQIAIITSFTKFIILQELFTTWLLFWHWYLRYSPNRMQPYCLKHPPPVELALACSIIYQANANIIDFILELRYVI